MIQLRVLGSTDLRGPEGQALLSILSQPKRLTLLTFLVLTTTGGFTRRDKLLTLFWPDSDPEKGRASLRRALSFLRGSLGDGVLVKRGDDEVGVAEGVIDCDAVRFQTLLGKDELEAAWALYGGALLDGVVVARSVDLEHWVEDARSRLKVMAVEAAARLAEQSESQGDLAGAVTWARNAVSLEPLSEVGIRRLIRLLGKAGDRERALRTYDTFRDRLAKELDLEPSAETRALIESVRSGQAAEQEHGPGTQPAVDAGRNVVRASTQGEAPVIHPGRVARTEEALTTVGHGQHAESLRRNAPQDLVREGRTREVRRKAVTNSGWRVTALVSSAVAVVLALAMFTTARTGTEPALRHFNLALPDALPLTFIGEAAVGVGQAALTLSPDGQQLVYVGPADTTTRLYTRSTGDGRVTALPGTEGAFAPFFSPDGEWIGFFAEQQLLRVSSDGERVQPLLETSIPLGGSWADDGRIAAVIHDGGPLAVIPRGGGEAALLHFDEDLIAHPFWLPGQEWILLTCYDPKHLCAASSSGELRHLTVDGPPSDRGEDARLVMGSNPRFVAPGYLVYSAPARNALLGVRFDSESLVVQGEPEVVYEGVRREAFLGTTQAAISTNGDLVLARGANADEGSFVWVDRTGAVESLPLPPRVYGRFYLAHDKRRLAAFVYPQVGPMELWFLDLGRGGPGRRWADQGLVGNRTVWPATWVPGTNRLLALALGESNLIFEIDTQRGIGGRILWSGAERGGPISVNAQGRILLRYDSPQGPILALMERDSFAELPATPSDVLEPVVRSTGRNIGGELSPDGRWLAYQTPDAGAYHVYAIPVDDPESPVRVSPGPGEMATWSPRGDGLYYRYGDKFYWVPFSESDPEPFGQAQLFAEGPFLNVNGPDMAVSADGARLLLLRAAGEESTTTLDVTLNFRARLAEVLTGGG